MEHLQRQPLARPLDRWALDRLVARWRHVGTRRALAAAPRRALREASALAREARLRRHPLAVSPEEVSLALGGEVAASVLADKVLPALPTVAAFAGELETMNARGRAALLAKADGVLAHRFDLLGSGPTVLGREIDWTRDFKTGRRWPLVHAARVRISHRDGSDIKVPWELSRFQHLPVLAAAFRTTGERRYLDEIGRQLEHWIESNPVELGPNWACTMEAAIRAANWVATLAVSEASTARDRWLEPVLRSLLLHARFIRSHLEERSPRGNHYLSNVVGLAVTASLFAGSDEGQAWLRWTAAELLAEMERQVRPDGCAHEGSIPYHRLVCELFVCGTHVIDGLLPGTLPTRYRRRLELMLEFAADTTRPDGLAPQIGDADSARFLPLGDYGEDPRRHDHLFAQASWAPQLPRSSAAYPHGGYYVARCGEAFVLVRCGDVGLEGTGAHAHNDQLAVELCVGRQPMIVDPGSYVYTANLAERNRYRSTTAHATLSIDGAEQNPFVHGEPFALPDRTRATATAWRSSDEATVFRGQHRGYCAIPGGALHQRTIELRAETLTIRDAILSDNPHELMWSFPLAPSEVRLLAGGAEVRFPGGSLSLHAAGVETWVEDAWLSPGYGTRTRAPRLRARRHWNPGAGDTCFVLRFRERRQ